MNSINKKIVLISITICLLSTCSLAQSKIDSLKNQLRLSDVNNKIEIYYQLTSSYQDISLDSSLKYANLGYALIDENHGIKKKNAYLNTLGRIYEKLNKFKIALKYLNQAYDGYELEKNKSKLLVVTLNIGAVYGQTCYYDKALTYFQRSLILSEELKDTLQICSSLINIGTVNQVMKDYKTALINYDKALLLATNINSKINIAHILRDISVTYAYMKDYKMALQYQKSSLEMYNKIGDKNYIAMISADIGEIYKKLNDFDKSLRYFEDAYKISKNIGDHFLTSHILYNIGDINISKKNFSKAKDYLSLAESTAIEVENRWTLRDIYESFSKYYSINNDYKKALDYYKRFKETTDSIYSKESSDKIAELQVKFEIQEKDKENEILLQKTEIQRLAINKQIYLRDTFIYISIIISLLVIFFFFRYWLKQRANKILSEKNEFINKQKDEIEEAYKTKDKLFAIITHDLKNPFGSIVALSKFLESNFYTLDDDHKFVAVQSIRKSISEVFDLLKKLTTWINSKGNNLILEKTNFDLSSTIFSVIRLYKTQAEQKSIDLQVMIESNVFVYGDERMIKTILRNLVDNAIKFSLEKGTIEIKATEDDGKIILSVSDTGVGIEEDDKYKIFNLETSFTTEGTDYETGGGLGLLLSKEFIEKNDGKIWFDSTTGKGSTFYFSIIKSDSNGEN